MTCSPQCMAGSPKGLTPRISRRPRRCWRPWGEGHGEADPRAAQGFWIAYTYGSRAFCATYWSTRLVVSEWPVLKYGGSAETWTVVASFRCALPVLALRRWQREASVRLPHRQERRTSAHGAV